MSTCLTHLITVYHFVAVWYYGYVIICFLAITVMFNQTMYSVIEDAGPARPVLVLSNPSSFEFSVNVTNTDGSATGKYCSNLINY